MKRLDNVDPINERREARSREQSEREKLMTFDQVKLMFFKPDDGAKAQHIVQRQAQIDRHAAPILGKMFVRDIDTPHISKVLDPIWYEIPELANRVRRRIENILDFAKVKGYRTGDNPARWEGHLDHVYNRGCTKFSTRSTKTGLPDWVTGERIQHWHDAKKVMTALEAATA